MKKTILLLAVLFSFSFVFTSCSDDDNDANVLGVWQCSGVGGTMAGISTGSYGGEYLKYFSIIYLGKSTGAFARIGTDDLSNLTSLVSGGSFSVSDYLSYGTFKCDSDAKTITHTVKGESTVYSYTLNNNILKLVEKKTSNSEKNGLLGALDAIFGVTGINTTTGIEWTYEYKGAGLDVFTSLFSSSN